MAKEQTVPGLNSIEGSKLPKIEGYSRTVKIVWWILFWLFTTFMAGYFFHSSPNPALFGKYSVRYSVVLVVITVFFAWCLWCAWRLRQNPGLILKWVVFILLIVATSVALLLPWCAWKYYVRGEHNRLKEPYHPFLQNDYYPNKLTVTKEKPSGVLRIVCLGGSTTANNWKVVPPSWGYPWYLDQEIERELGSGAVEVINLGTPMYSSEHSLIIWLTVAQDYHPDIVIVMHAVNDLIRSFENSSLTLGPFRSDYGHYYGSAVNYAIPRQPYLERLVDSEFFKVWYSDFRETEDEVIKVPFDNFRSLPVFKRNLRMLADNIKLAGVKLIFLTQPFLYHESMTPQEFAMLKFPHIFCVEHGKQADVPSLLTGMKHFNEITRLLAREKDIPYVDLEAIIPSDLEHFIDDVHYTKRTKETIAKEIAQRLQVLGWTAECN